MNDQPLLQELDDGVLTLTLNRPDVLNALSMPLRVALHDAVERAASDTAVRCLVITGAGRGFCSGADVNEMTPELHPARADAMRTLVHPTALRLMTMDKPVVAAVNGVAAGAGCGLALAADLIIAAESTRFHFPFLRLGLVPDWGLLYTLPRLVGLARARELVFSTRPVDAVEALRLGMVNRVVPDLELAGAVASLAQDLAAAPPAAVGLSKRLLNESLDRDLPAMLDAEIEAQQRCFASPEHEAAARAFREKQPLRFSGARLP